MLRVVADEAVGAEAGALVENIEVELGLLRALHLLGDLIGHHNVDFAVSEQHEFVRNVSILENNLPFGVSFDLELADDLVYDFIRHITEIVHIFDHLPSELHLFILVVIDIIYKLFGDMWKISF